MKSYSREDLYFTDTHTLSLFGFNTFLPTTKLYRKISVSKEVLTGLFLYRFYFQAIYFRVRSKTMMMTNNIEFLALSKQYSF